MNETKPGDAEVSENAGDEEAQSQAVQRAAIQKGMMLPSHHYLRKSQPLPAGLVAAAGVCAIDDSLAYRLLTSNLHTKGHLSGGDACI